MDANCCDVVDWKSKDEGERMRDEGEEEREQNFHPSAFILYPCFSWEYS